MTIALQRVEHPIPLAVRKEKTEAWKGPFGPFDGTNTVVRYDLVKGDWLPPVGKGEWPDIVFRSEVMLRGTHQDKGISRVTTFYDLVTTVEMPGEGNGLAMRMASPTAGVKLRLAPEEGYARSQILMTGQRRQVVGVVDYEVAEASSSRWYHPGCKAWKMSKPRMLPEPFPVKGFVGMWNLTSADAKRILEQLKG